MDSRPGIWGRIQEQVKEAADQTRRTTRWAVQTGILRVDLVSLRRDRTRALAGLGERALRLWRAGTPAMIEGDAEAARLRALLDNIEGCIASKEAELAELRRTNDETTTREAGRPGAVRTEESNGIA